MYTVRSISEKDAPLLMDLAKRCDLQICPEQTYWAIAKYYYYGSFILEDEGTPIGYIMTVNAPSTILIWQIGILKEYRKKGLSKELISAVTDYAGKMSKDLEIIIAENNTACNAAFSNFCGKNKLQFQKIGNLDITDLNNSKFLENEILYRTKR